MSVDKARLVGQPRQRVTEVARIRSGATAPPPLRGADLVDAAHGAGLGVYTWTLRPENRFLSAGYRRGTARSAYGDWLGEFTEIIGTGVDGIFVDHPISASRRARSPQRREASPPRAGGSVR